MPVTPAMITELSDALMKDQAILHPSFHLSNFKRQGASADFNRQATEKNEAYSRIRYAGQPLNLLLQQSTEAYEQLKNSMIDIDFALVEYAWLAPYLPLFNSEMLHRMMEKHRTDYLYTDESEICLQSMIVLMLAYHSNPILFTENQAQFEVMANTWLKTILTFNDIKKPELRSHIDGWHDNSFCSAERNLKFMQYCAEAYYKASKNTVDVLHNMVSMMSHLATNPEAINKIDFWNNRMVAFNEVNKVLFKVLRDHEKLNSHAFVDAVRRVQYIHQNQNEFTGASVIVSVANAVAEEHEHDDSVTVAAVMTHQQPEPDIVIASTEEEEIMRQAGVGLIRSGLSRLSFLADSTQHHTNDSDEDEVATCVIQ
ncbi:MAG: hypothetical protein Q8R83_04190 [Legionellaceae bacterium]|nr:hypothetical protein [Legionellaceae bacterium]